MTRAEPPQPTDGDPPEAFEAQAAWVRAHGSYNPVDLTYELMETAIAKSGGRRLAAEILAMAGLTILLEDMATATAVPEFRAIVDRAAKGGGVNG